MVILFDCLFAIRDILSREVFRNEIFDRPCYRLIEPVKLQTRSNVVKIKTT